MRVPEDPNDADLPTAAAVRPVVGSDLVWLSATELAVLYRSREVSPVDVVRAVLDRLDQVEPELNAFVTVTRETALSTAREAERALLRDDPDELGPLTGVPVSLKDLIRTAGVRTTFGAVAFRDEVPATDDVDWSRLKGAGAILVGKTTTPEFGMLGVTDSGLTGVTNNPWDVALTAGGSSGGAAASVAAGVAPIAWGNDGGGSIRIPAACCGVVGLKPSGGRVPSASSPFEIAASSGPLTRTVADAALALSVTAGHHPSQPLSLPTVDPRLIRDCVLTPDIRGMRIAIAPGFGMGSLDDEVWAAVRAGVDVLVDLGATASAVDLHLPDPVTYFQDFWGPSIAALIDDLRTLPGWSDDSLHPVMFEISAKGRRASALDLVRAQGETRGRIAAAFAEVFESNDLLVVPTMPLPAFPHPGRLGGPAVIAGEPSDVPAIDFHRLTEPPSHAGLPAITMPCGFSGAGVPIGMQIIGPWHGDMRILTAAASFEQATPWHTHRPAL